MKIEDVMIDAIPQGNMCDLTYLLRMTHEPTNISVEDIVLYTSNLPMLLEKLETKRVSLYGKLERMVDEHIERQKDKLPLARCLESETI